jgi:UDP-N-acetylmuramoyl-L-alanyl-D-glutamate--2,6-diaminopimelate ligase
MRKSVSEKQPVSIHRILPGLIAAPKEECWASSFRADTRTLLPGDVFVAIEGRQFDGHDFLSEAVSRGCAAVVTEQPVEELSVPVFQVADSRRAFAALCHAAWGHPGEKLKMIGVTGTNGKTTTSYLIAGMLAEAGHSVGLSGTLGSYDGESMQPISLTTPPADELAAWMARLVENGCTHAVIEASSHGIAQSRLAGIEFDAVCLTNLRRDHLDYHRTVEQYRQTKLSLFGQLRPGGLSICNADDRVSGAILPLLNGPVLTVGMHGPAEIEAVPVERNRGEQTFLVTAGSDMVPIRTRMIGDDHVYNCLIAAALGIGWQIDLKTIVRGIERVEHVPGRLERIDCGQPFGVFVDYAHTSDALIGSLRTLREVTAGKLICVFGAGGDRDRSKRPLMGQAVESMADVAVVTNDNPRSESPELIRSEIMQGFSRPCRAREIARRSEAICWALANAGPDDCVLIAGKGHEDHQIVGDQRLPFCDRRFAQLWLYENLPCSQPALGF